MSRLVFVKGGVGEAVGTAGGAVAGAARGAALGSVIPVVGTALGGLVGGLMGAKTGGKIGDAVTGGEGGEGGESGGKKNNAGKFAAQQMQNQADKRQQANQQSMQNNQAMAEKAKANSEIKTGEPMNMSWRLLKDWHWNGELSPRERKAIVERARMARKKGNHAHMESVPSEHHDDQFAERYHPHQKMPLDAAGLDPHEIATAMGDMYLENHPELKQALDEELPHPADPNQTNTPSMVFHALRTDNPKISNNTLWDSYSPVITRPSAFSRPQVHTAINSPAGRGSGKRHTIRISSVRDYPHSYPEHNNSLPSKFNLVEPLSNVKNMGEPVEAAKLRRDYRIRQLGAGEEKWRNKILDVEGGKSDKIEEDVITQLAGQSRIIEQQDAKAAKQRAIEAEKEQASAAKEQGELTVTQNEYMPGFYNVTDPAYDIRGKMIGPGMHDVGEGYDYYHNHFQNQQNVQTGEPMDLAWRLLKYDEEENLYYDDYGMPRDPRINPAFDLEENVIDDIDGWKLDDEIDEIRDTPGFHDGVETEFTPEEIKEKERRKKVKESVAGFLQSQKLASEPMSLAWRMLKQMSDDDMQEWAYENLRNQGITIPDEREEEVVPKPKMPTLYY